MGPKDVILKNLEMSDVIIKKYLDDLSDADLRLEGVPGMNSIALQLGHLISGERMMVEYVSPGISPELPAGFDDAHSLKGDVKDRRLASKDEYMKLWDAQRAATKKSLESVSDAELEDTRGGKLPEWAPTVGEMLNLTGLHAVMHSGQFVAVRRGLKKGIAF
jgi:DinB superfamily